MKFLVVVSVVCIVFISQSVQESKPKKSVVDMTDAEIEKLAEEWDVSKTFFSFLFSSIYYLKINRKMKKNYQKTRNLSTNERIPVKILTWKV